MHECHSAAALRLAAIQGELIGYWFPNDEIFSSAPKGQRIVATGEATPLWAERNPWDAGLLYVLRPKGATAWMARDAVSWLSAAPSGRIFVGGRSPRVALRSTRGYGP